MAEENNNQTVESQQENIQQNTPPIVPPGPTNDMRVEFFSRYDQKRNDNK